MTERSDQLDQLATALSAFQGDVGAVPKTADNKFFSSKYADLATVAKHTTPILAKHGLSVSQFPGADEQGDTLTTWLLHKSGQFIAQSMRLYSAPGKGLTAAQGQGSAMTYGRRYAYMAALGLVADVDDDGNGAPRTRSAVPRPEPVAQQPNGTERIATAKQRGLIFAKAGDVKMPSSVLANIVLVSAGSEPREFDSEDAAQAWLKRALDRLPAKSVDPILANIEAEVAAA